MSRIQRMQTVSGVLGDRLDAALRALIKARSQLAQEHARLQQLQTFRDEYGQHHTGAGAATVSAFQLQDFNAFVCRLDTAITQQSQQIRKAENNVAACQRHWQSERSRFDAVNKLLENYQAADRRLEDQAEQLQSDDYAVQRYVSNKDP